MANIFDQYDMDYTSSLNNALRDASVIQTGKIEDGKYQAKVNDIKLMPSKKYQDELQLGINFQIIEGDYKGRFCSRYYAVIPEFMDRIKTDMHTLGLDLEDDIRKLGEEETLEMLIGRIVDITIKNKRSKTNGQEYMNVYINRLVSLGEFEEVEDDDDDNPFE